MMLSELGKHFYHSILAPYEKSPYSVASRVRIFVFLLLVLWPTFLVLVVSSYLLQGAVANLFLGAAMTVLVGFLLFLLKSGKADAAVWMFTWGLFLLLVTAHFTGDYRQLNGTNPLLINRLFYLGALNLVLAALLTEKATILLLLMVSYLACAVVQVGIFQFFAMNLENRLLLLPSAYRAGFVFPFFAAFTLVLQRVSHRAVRLAEQARLSLEEEVTQRTSDLRDAVERLQVAQRSLVEGEKLAALGRLSANVAHEVNTPLGAIHSSAGNVLEHLGPLTHQFFTVSALLTPGNRDQFEILLHRCDFGYNSQGRKERKKLSRTLADDLKARKVPNAPEVAESLAELGVTAIDSDWAPLLRHSQLPTVLGLAHSLVNLHRSAGIITEATSKASEFIVALRRFTFQSDDTREMEPLDLTSSLETVLTLLKPELSHGIHVVRRFNERPLVLGYPNQLHQVWSNLLHNAVQAMKGKGTLKLTIRGRESDVVVEVEDTGEGIPEMLKEKIFEPFFTTKRIGEGTGLGLKIVQDFVAMNQGTLDFDSEPGRTVFRVTLKRARNDE